MRIRELSAEIWLPHAREKVFAFFGDPGNLGLITPPSLGLQIVKPRPVAIQKGTLIDYTVRIRGIPVRWRTLISAWEPPHRFVDEQLRGPYRLWVHEHTFEVKDGGTLAKDHVRYSAPLDLLTHSWLVRPDLERIFAFRAATLRKIFEVSS